MIVIEKLTKSFGSKKVIDQLSVELKAGECVFILGKSGVGKSVLLKNIVGLTQADSGSIFVSGVKVEVENKATLAEIRKNCGLVFQFPALLDSATVYENICFGLKTRTQNYSLLELQNKVKEKISLVGLKEEVLSCYPAELSYGAQKRVSIARMLAVEPQVLLFDEPTTGLDPIVTEGLNQLILYLSTKLKLTTVVVSHDIKSAIKIAQRIILLDAGKIVFDGTANEFCSSGVPLAKEFQIGL